MATRFDVSVVGHVARWLGAVLALLRSLNMKVESLRGAMFQYPAIGAEASHRGKLSQKCSKVVRGYPSPSPPKLATRWGPS